MAVQDLQNLLNDYLESSINFSLNALSKKICVPETSLRRIKNGDLRRLPKIDNVLKILKYIYKTDSLYEIVKLAPEELSKELQEKLVIDIEDNCTTRLVVDLEKFINDQVAYLVYKLASNTNGVKSSEVNRLFGEHGVQTLLNLEKAGVITNNDKVFKTIQGTFRMSDDRFVENFKSVSNFIKTDPEKIKTPNLYMNLSESLNIEGLKRIKAIQVRAIRETRKVLSCDEYKGHLPVFNLIAVDTLD